MPTQNHPTPITLAARRMTAAAVVAEASGLGTLTASLLVDVVDITTAATLGSVGLDAVEIRRAAAAIWGARRTGVRRSSATRVRRTDPPRRAAPSLRWRGRVVSGLGRLSADLELLTDEDAGG
jgi:hypothetical protein